MPACLLHSPTSSLKSERQLGLIWGAVAALLVCLSPLVGRLASALPACPVKLVAGVPCLTCGSTRSAVALARMDVVAAVAINPLATLGWIALIGGGLIAGSLALLGRPLREPGWHLSVPWRCALGSLLLANWLYLIGMGT